MTITELHARKVAILEGQWRLLVDLKAKNPNATCDKEIEDAELALLDAQIEAKK